MNTINLSFFICHKILGGGLLVHQRSKNEDQDDKVICYLSNRVEIHYSYFKKMEKSLETLS